MFVAPNKGESWMCDQPCDHRDCNALREFFESTCSVCHNTPKEGEYYIILEVAGGRITKWVHARCIPDVTEHG